MLSSDFVDRLLARITQGVTFVETPQGWVAIWSNHRHIHTFPNLHDGHEYGYNHTKLNLRTGKKKKCMHVEVDIETGDILSFKY